MQRNLSTWGKRGKSTGDGKEIQGEKIYTRAEAGKKLIEPVLYLDEDKREL